MKKIFLMLAALFLITNVNASETKVTSENELRTCVAQEKATCTLDDEITLSQYLVVNTGSDITLNLNSKTLNLADHSNYAIVVKGKLTIEGDGTVNIPGLYGIGTSVGLGTLVIKGGTYNQETGDYLFGNFNSLTIENGTFNGNYCIVNSFEYSGVKYTATIKGGTFNNAEEETIVLGYVTVEGGTFNYSVDDYLAEGYASRKENDNYIVGKLYKIVGFEDANITVKPNKTEAIAGEEITLTVSTRLNYKVNKLEIKNVEIKDNKFIMPQNDAEIVAEAVLEEIIKNTDLFFEEKNLNIVEDTIKNNEELNNITQSTETSVDIQIERIEDEKLPQDKKDIITKAAGKSNIAEYFDITVALVKSEDNTELKKIEKLDKKMPFRILLAEDLKNNDKDVKRTYFVIREHDGESEILPCTLSDDGKYLTFETDKFSIYALAYEDVKIAQEANPETSDNLIQNALVISTALISFGGLYLVMKKRIKKVN